MSKEWTPLQSLIQMFREIPNNFRSIYFLIATQFFASLNNNLFRILVIFFMINAKGLSATNSMISLTGIIYVIPYLLFISAAGILADRISKQKILVFTKFLELMAMSFGLWMVWIQSEIGVFLALFLMSTQNSIFMPSRYGIVLETVDLAKLSKVTGMISSSSLFASTLGTFLSPVLVDLANKNFTIVSGSCIFIAMIGLLTSLGITPTNPQNSKKEINPIFFYEIYETLKISKEIPHILPAIFGYSYFFFIASFVQLNLIPYAIQSLRLTDVQGGYLFLPTAIGIIIGAISCGYLSKNRVEPGISCIAGIFLSISFLGLYLLCASLICSVSFLFFIGIFGGFFLVPMESFIQAASPDSKRGRITAAANFFVFVSFLLAASSIYLIGVILNLKASVGFGLLGIITLFAILFMTGRLSGFFIAFVMNRIIYSSKKIQLCGPEPKSSQILLLDSKNWMDILAVIASYSGLKILIPIPHAYYFSWLKYFFETIRAVPFDSLLQEQKKYQDKNSLVCIFLHRRNGDGKEIDLYKKTLEEFGAPLLYLSFDRSKRILSAIPSQQ